MRLLSSRMQTMNMAGGLYDIYQKALRMEAEGKSIIHMEIGRPDFDSPKEAKEVTIQALNNGEVHYTAMSGIPELRKAICDKEFKANDIVADPDKEIVVTAGACEALISVMMAILDPGEEIMIPSPYFSAYEEIAHIIGVKLNDVPLSLENNFELRVEDLEAHYNPNVKAVLINTPSNPSGAVVSESELVKIAAFAQEKDILVISDETYDQFLFEGVHKSISTLPCMKERTIVINSTSKVFAMTGWRVGYAITPAALMPYVNKIHQNMSTCATSFVQYGAAEAYRSCGEFTKNMVKKFKERRDIIVDALKQCDKIEFSVPQGAFYIFPKISAYGLSSREFCNRLLDEAGIASTPGDTFGKAGVGFIRLAYGCSKTEVIEAMDRFVKFTKTL